MRLRLGTYTSNFHPSALNLACVPNFKSLYGTRDATLNWAQAYTEVLEGIGFVMGRSSPCCFHHAKWQIRTVVHGDDFLSEGPGEHLMTMNEQMKKSFSLKTEVLSGDPGDVQSIKVLNRQISWKSGEIHWEADPRHVDHCQADWARGRQGSQNSRG